MCLTNASSFSLRLTSLLLQWSCLLFLLFLFISLMSLGRFVGLPFNLLFLLIYWRLNKEGMQISVKFSQLPVSMVAKGRGSGGKLLGSECWLSLSRGGVGVGVGGETLESLAQLFSASVFSSATRGGKVLRYLPGLLCGLSK